MYNIIGDKNIQIGNNNNNTTNNGNSNGNIVLDEMREKTETPKTIDRRFRACFFRYLASKPQYLFLFLRSESPYIFPANLKNNNNSIIASDTTNNNTANHTATQVHSSNNNNDDVMTHRRAVGKIDASDAIDEDDKDDDENYRTPSIASLSQSVLSLPITAVVTTTATVAAEIPVIPRCCYVRPVAATMVPI